MFNNIGGKIKTLAEFSCWIGIIASIIGGLILMNNGMTVSGFITIAVGSLVSWIGSFFTYGFGQLIENSDKIANTMDYVKSSNSKTGKNKTKNNAKGSSDDLTDDGEYVICSNCKAKWPCEYEYCPDCLHVFKGVE